MTVDLIAEDVVPLPLAGGMALKELRGLDGRPGVIGLWRDSECAASAELTPLEQTQLAGLRADDTTLVLRSVCLTRGDDRAALCGLLYAASRRARLMQRANVAIQASEDQAGGLAAIGRLSPLSEKSSHLLVQRTGRVAHEAAQMLERSGARPTGSARAKEVEEAATQWLSGAPSWGFFRSVREGSLSRQQYVYALSNVYQFVRQTTRICARAIAASPTAEQRAHFIEHLSGEVNHELIIERDLAHLGEDVAFVREHMAPNGPTREFMAIQESLIGYYHDPVLLLASPVAAEGVSAHLTREFADGLKACVASWGVDNPLRAIKFFLSHMSYDGGADGHWRMTLDYLASCLTDESVHQQFMCNLFSAMRATACMYESFTVDVPGVEGMSAAGSAGTADCGAHAQPDLDA